MKFTKVPTDTFERIQLNAGILLTEFDPATGTAANANIIGATSGGNSFAATPNFIDFGEDVDNVPNNTKELKRLDYFDVTMSGTFVTADTAAAKMLVGAADIDGTDTTKVQPRGDLLQTDFTDIWWVGDYSDKNGATNGGYIAIKLKDALSTGGFQIQSGDKAKGQLAYEFTGHYSIADEDLTPPFEIYIKKGIAE